MFFKRLLNPALSVVCCCIVLASAADVLGQNSTRTQRVEPNQLSSKIGTAVNWAPSYAAALRKSKETGKPVFWYISTVPGTFMDRKPVIDRYMLGGIFSWPPLVELINENFVPLRVVPDPRATVGATSVKGIRPYQFVEPGFVIVSAEGKEVFRLDQLTTLHYEWLEELIGQVLKKNKQEFKRTAWPKYFAEFAGPETSWVDPVGDKFEKSVSNYLLSGMIAFRKGNHELAKERWQMAAKLDPENPLAWKASLEAQGIGPFVRGFEVFRKLPDKAKLAGITSRGSQAPSDTFSRHELIGRSIEFLLGMQRQDGGIVDSDYDFGGFDSLPNVHVAVTSLSGMALLKAAKSNPDNLARIEQALLKIEKFVTDPANLNPADRDEILWAHAYRLRFLCRLFEYEKLNSKIENQREKIAAAVSALEGIQLKTGNWYHEYNNPFVTATALCALSEAQRIGGKVDMEKINRGIKSLELDRIENGSYPYYSVKRKTDATAAQQNRMLAAAAGRMPLCELALVLWKKKGQKELVAAVSNSLDNHRHLASAYKYDNHTSNMAYGGFFFWYDMRSRSEAIRAISSPEVRAEFQKKHQALISRLPEVDGCFVDSHELGRCYGTAMAILSMD